MSPCEDSAAPVGQHGAGVGHQRRDLRAATAIVEIGDADDLAGRDQQRVEVHEFGTGDVAALFQEDFQRSALVVVAMVAQVERGAGAVRAVHLGRRDAMGVNHRVLRRVEQRVGDESGRAETRSRT